MSYSPFYHSRLTLQRAVENNGCITLVMANKQTSFLLETADQISKGNNLITVDTHQREQEPNPRISSPN